MTTDEMVEILDGIARGPETNPTARVSALRLLREIVQTTTRWDDIDEAKEAAIYAIDDPRRRGRPRPR